jgi:cysteine synthase
MIKKSILDIIGNSPLVELSRITKKHKLRGRILAKLEYLNFGFSKKDRVALQMILEAEEEGILKPGQTVVELTSGNTGIGLAIVCAIKGYKFVAIMSKGNSDERRLMIEALGAEVVLVDQATNSIKGEVSGEDLKLVEIKTQEVTKQRDAFRADQFNLKGNFNAYYLNIAPEIWNQTNGNFDGICDFVGSGGTFAGCSAFFKNKKPKLKCYVIEPKGAAVIAGKDIENPGHPIQGGGYSIQNLKFIDKNNIDGFIEVTGKDAKFWANELASVEGIFAGYSAGANLFGAVNLLGNEMINKTIVILICDSGLKYLSTDLWKKTVG